MIRWLNELSILNIIRLMAAAGCAALLALSACVVWGRYDAELQHRQDVAQAGPSGALAPSPGTELAEPWAKALGEARGVLMLAGLAVALTLVVTGLVTRRIGQGLLRAEAAARAIAEGDLSPRPQTVARNELDRLLQVMGFMAGQLTASVGQVRACADEMALASEAIAGGSRDLAQRSQQAAAQLQDTAAAMGEIQGAARDTAAAAREASQAVAVASDAARQGGEVMSDVARTMGDIQVGSQRMQDIISVIDGIAFRTNILALNAAVEAARAGEQGRGFAVVANEVRQLSQRSAEAAREIKGLLRQSVAQVEDGTALAAEAGTAMRQIVQRVSEVSAVVQRLASQAGDQATQTRELGQAMQSIDEMTQQNAALVEQSAASAALLRGRATAMDDTVHSFSL